MRLILHIFRKDARRLWLAVGAIACGILMLAVLVRCFIGSYAGNIP